MGVTTIKWVFNNIRATCWSCPPPNAHDGEHLRRPIFQDRLGVSVAVAVKQLVAARGLSQRKITVPNGMIFTRLASG
jgi:hypothetical protein